MNSPLPPPVLSTTISYFFHKSGRTPGPAPSCFLVIRSDNARSRGGLGLEKVLELGEPEGVRAYVLFVPAQPGEWLARVEELMTRRTGAFRAIVGVDSLRTMKPRG